jgi:hypothetical protein
MAAKRLETGDAGWEVLRYLGEWPTLTLARAFARGWESVPARVRDEALLTTTVLPVSTRDEYEAWCRRIAAYARDDSDEVRHATFVALWTWRPDDAHEACERALSDVEKKVRVAAARALAVIDPELLAERVEELETEYPELVDEVPFSVRVTRAERRRR